MEGIFGQRPDDVWQDREIRFDVSAAEQQCRRGENLLDLLVGDPKAQQ